MKTPIKSLSSALFLVLAQSSFAIAASGAAVAPAPAAEPVHWIQYEDATLTPVLDDVSGHLAAARRALGEHDKKTAAEAVLAAAQALQAQSDRAVKLDRQRAAADLNSASATHAKMMTVVQKLNAVAADIQSGKVPTTAALDRTFDAAARADLERRWQVTDVTTWYPVVEEPQRHFGAAMQDYAKKDYRAAAIEVRKAEAYVRLEAARATRDTKAALDSARAELERTAQSLDKGVIGTAQTLDQTFARTSHALALAQRAKAADSWAHKAYSEAGYQLKAAAHELESAAAWTSNEAKTLAAPAVSETRALGDKLTRGGDWASSEVAKGFNTLTSALTDLGHRIDSKVQRTASKTNS